jgi:DNA-directed RNA polymerase subunit RPC12/RpoP
MMKGMTSVLVVVCSRCGGFLLARAEQKTRTCPYCGFKVDLDKAKKIASTGTAQEAATILRKLKGEAALKRKHSSRL